MFTELGWTRDLCDHIWSQAFLGHPAASDDPALGHGYLPSMSRPMETAAALRACSREVTPGRGTWPQPEKTMCRRQTRPCSHPPSSPKAAESRSPGVQMEKCSQSFAGNQRIPVLAALTPGRGAPRIVTMLPGLWQDSEMEIEAEVMRNMRKGSRHISTSHLAHPASAQTPLGQAHVSPAAVSDVGAKG